MSCRDRFKQVLALELYPSMIIDLSSDCLLLGTVVSTQRAVLQDTGGLLHQIQRGWNITPLYGTNITWYVLFMALPCKAVTIYRYHMLLRSTENWLMRNVQLILLCASLPQFLIPMLTSGQDCRLYCHCIQITLATSGPWAAGMIRIL